jgi:hypothetical protein
MPGGTVIAWRRAPHPQPRWVRALQAGDDAVEKNSPQANENLAFLN